MGFIGRRKFLHITLAVPIAGLFVKTASGQHKTHIKNRRLFGAAAGTHRLETWERQHLHRCEVCQRILTILLNQPNL